MENNRPGPKTPEGLAKVTQNLPTEMPADWKISEKGLEAIRTAVSMSNTKHGLVASVPIICKGRKCPYVEACYLIDQGLDVPGERCPLEIATIMDRFERYTTQLDIQPDNIVDMSIVKNLVDIEIQLMRADKKIAMNGDFIDQVIAAVSPQGDAYYKPELGKAADFKLRLIEKHSSLLSLLHSTRKDKAGDKLSVTIDASNYAASLIKRKEAMQKQLEQQNTIDIKSDGSDE